MVNENFGNWLDHENRILMNGIIALTKETPESSLPAFTIGGHSKKMGIYEPWSRPSQDTGSAYIVILDISASKTVKTKCLLFKSPHLGRVVEFC